MTITPAALRAEIEKIAAEQPDHKAEHSMYIFPNVEGPFAPWGNWSEGYVPMCIVGTAAERLQPGIFEPLAVDHPEPQSVNTNIVTDDRVQEILFGEIHERTADIVWIEDVQHVQDLKRPWSEAVDDANNH